MSYSTPPPAGPAGPAGPPPRPLQPHRDAAVLTLGILALTMLFCYGIGMVPGVIAWVLGNADLKEMDAGRMDPSGRSLTKAGQVCGMVATCVGALLVIIMIAALVVGLALKFSSGPQSSSRYGL